MNHAAKSLTMGDLSAYDFGTALEYSEGLSGLSRWYAMADRDSVALVLEDTELGRWALTRALQAEGFNVAAASTWAEASARLVRERFTLVVVAVSSILDDVADIVASICRDHPETHLVLLVDQDSIRDIRSMCGQRTDVLGKPLDLQEVARVARSWPAATSPPPGP